MQRHRMTVLCLLALLTLSGCSSQTQATEPPTEQVRGPLWAYGTEVAGEPWFDVRDGIAYYQGVVQYWPRLPREDGLPDPPELWPSDPFQKAHLLLTQANARAATAQTRYEWLEGWVGTLEQHRDVAEDFDIGWSEITIQFEGLPDVLVKTIPTQFPVPQPKAVDRDEAVQQQIDRFMKKYQEGCWILIGSDYLTFVPPQRQQKTVEAIDAVNALIDQGLAGPELKEAVTSIDVQDTPLEDDSKFLRDLMAQERRQ